MSEPADASVPALGLSNEQLRRLSEAVVSSVESRITVPSAVNIPASQRDPLEPEPGTSLSDMMNVELVTAGKRPFKHC